MNYLFLKILPKNLISRFAGYLAGLTVPAPLLKSLIQVYCKFYSVQLNEVKKPLDSFKNFTEFFTRELNEDARSVDSTPNTVVSPVDGTIAEFGDIKNGLLVQTKGIYYSLNDLVGKKLAVEFEDGFFITIYLSPADYHRIHTPIAGKVKSFNYFSGNLWPVNKIGVQNIGSLFAVNERIVTPIQSKIGNVLLIKVGATVVGKISLDYHELKTNQRQKQSQSSIPVIPAKNYKKGQEIGQFQLGSTVILIFSKKQITPFELENGKKIKLGEKIGSVNQ